MFYNIFIDIIHDYNRRLFFLEGEVCDTSRWICFLLECYSSWGNCFQHLILTVKCLQSNLLHIQRQVTEEEFSEDILHYSQMENPGINIPLILYTRNHFRSSFSVVNKKAKWIWIAHIQREHRGLEQQFIWETSIMIDALIRFVKYNALRLLDEELRLYERDVEIS